MNINLLSKSTTSHSQQFCFGDIYLSLFEYKAPFPPYACISYAWGDELAPHPLDKNTTISNRTLPALATPFNAYQHLQQNNELDLPEVNHYWVDGLCMPSSGKERDLQIFLLGEIYNKAALVLVVLSNPFITVLEKVKEGQPFSEHDYEIINNDNWVARYWTYQEIVKSSKVYIVAESNPLLPIHASDFFYKLSQEFDVFCSMKDLKTIEAMNKYKYISALEAVICDEKIQEKRSIYQVMVNMEYIKSINIQSKLTSLYSYMAEREYLDVLDIENDYEKFYALCIRNNDFSFIFNTSKDRATHKQKWKPLAYDFKPIYAWLYCWGSKQHGSLHQDFLLLEDMIIAIKGKASYETVAFLSRVLKENVRAASTEVLELMFTNLKSMQFEGCLYPIELENGFYFDQIDDAFHNDNAIAICFNVKWTFGAPAMKLKKRAFNDHYDFISAGVFFGQIRTLSKSLHTIKID